MKKGAREKKPKANVNNSQTKTLDRYHIQFWSHNVRQRYVKRQVQNSDILSSMCYIFILIYLLKIVSYNHNMKNANFNRFPKKI